MRDSIKILGVRIDNLSRTEINGWIKNVLVNSPEQKFVVTLNPEIILKGHRDKDYKNILNSADFNLCDGFGIKIVSRIKGRRIKSRYTGVDLIDYSFKKAKEKNLKVLIIFSKNSLSSPEEVREAIRKKYNLEANGGYLEGNFFESEETKNAEIVFVNFGAPDQENFIFENKKYFPNAKILAGIGGAFDFMTGKIKRAPKWMRKAGLEWLWRLWQEPQRLKRIKNAVIVFPWIFLTNKDN